jgi:ABC-type branched-subunit amino acid transport system substrate-binding protein
MGVEKGLGAPVANKQTYVVTNQNVGPQIGAFKAAGCGVIVLAAIPGFVALAIGTAAAIGYFPQWVADGVGGDYLTLSGYLKDKTAALLQNFISLGYLPGASDDTNPWNAFFKQINKNFNGDAPYDNNIVYGMSVGYLFVQALQAAGQNLTREGLMAAIEKGGFTGPGIVPLLYSSSSHAGYAGGRLTKVDKGVQSYFGDTYTTDAADGAVQTYTGTPVAPPAY